MLRFPKALALALVATLGIGACAPTAQNTAQSLAQEQRAAQQFVSQLEAKDKLIKDRSLNNYVSGIVGKIWAQRPRGAVPLRSYIIKDADVNAFTPGGGYVFVNAGLLAAMENEAQFASVIAHEIAHIDRGHIQAGRGARQGAQIGAALGQIAGAALGVPTGVTDLVVGVGASAAVSSFTRTQERDADQSGIRYLAGAGYNAMEGARSFEVLKRLYGDRGGFLASHPASSERQATLNQMAQQLGATKGRIAEKTYDSRTRKIRRQVLQFYEQAGRDREAAQIRRNLR